MTSAEPSGVDVDFDAELLDWVLIHWPNLAGWPVLIGRVMNDRKGRFADGRLIRTSVVLTPRAEVITGQIIQTLNSRYMLRDEH